MRNLTLSRLGIFAAVAGLHVVLLLFLVIRLDPVITEREPDERVMKLTDIREEVPPARPASPPPLQPPPPEEPTGPAAVEPIAENMIETDEAPSPVTAVSGDYNPGAFSPWGTAGGQEEYLPMHLISSPPVFSEREILAALVYPPIALRSRLEGLVYLELFVDRRGEVREVVILKEDPSGRGFGEAAAAAFRGRRARPAEANGQAVAARYRYPVRFTIRN
jgi:protein TonB